MKKIPIKNWICLYREKYRGKIFLVDFFISLVTAHLADGVLQHGVLLVEVVHSLFTLSVIVHWRLEEEAQEALGAVTAGTGCKVAQQAEVEQQWSGKDGVAAQEVDLDLHWITHPAEDVDVVPTLLVVVARRIIVDANLVIILSVLIVAMAVEVWLDFWLQNSLKGRELAHLLGMEVGWLIENETVAVAKNVGREPTFKPRQRVPMIGAKPLFTRV